MRPTAGTQGLGFTADLLIGKYFLPGRNIDIDQLQCYDKRKTSL
jgi:hypothetical protein